MMKYVNVGKSSQFNIGQLKSIVTQGYDLAVLKTYPHIIIAMENCPNINGVTIDDPLSKGIYHDNYNSMTLSKSEHNTVIVDESIIETQERLYDLFGKCRSIKNRSCSNQQDYCAYDIKVYPTTIKDGSLYIEIN